MIAGRTFMPKDAEARVEIIGLDIAEKDGIARENLDETATAAIRGQPWCVIGVFDGGSGFTNGQVFLPFDAMREVFGASGVSRLLVSAPS